MGMNTFGAGSRGGVIRRSAAHIWAAALSVTVTALLWTPRLTMAQTESDWTGDIGNWSDSSNWNNGTPTSSDAVFMTNGGTAVIAQPGAVGSQVFIGLGNLNVNSGGSLSDSVAFINAGGSVTVQDAGSSLSNTNDLYVGNDGTGNATLTVQTGGTVSSNSTFLGASTGCSGSVTVDGQNSQLTNAAGLYVGNTATGTLTVQNGAMVSNANTWIGGTAQGTVTVNGSGSSLSTTGNVYVGGSYDGGNGTGTLLVQSGATLAAARVYVDQASTLTVAGAASTATFSGDVYSDGNINVQNGGSLTATGSGWVSGALIVDGSGTSASIHGSLYPGNAITVQNGGRLTVGGDIEASGAVGTVGAGSAIACSGLITDDNTLKFGLGSPVSGSNYSGGTIAVGSDGLNVGSGTNLAFIGSTGGWATGNYRLIGGNIGGANLSNFVLPSHPAAETLNLTNTADPGYVDLNVAVATVQVVRSPTVAPPTPTGESLWIFDRKTQSWSQSILPVSTQNTVVLTPGWRNTGLQDWPTTMAQDMAKITNSNIVTWDWQSDAHSTIAGDLTPEAGTLLASALEQELPGYTGNFQFIGHSLGTLVNRQAIESLVNTGTSGQQIDDTILDAPEDIPINAGSWIGLNSTNSNPVPAAGDYVHLDNYITAFGNLHSQARNVVLSQGAIQGLIGWHSYAHDWYDASVNNVGVGTAGFGTTPTAGTYYLQSPNLFTPLEVDNSSAGDLSHWISTRDAAWGLEKSELLAVDGIRGAIQYVGDVTTNGILELESDVTIDSTPVYITTPQFVLNGHSGSYVWVPVHIPSNASALSFNTIFQNVPSGDSLVVGIDNTVLFTLEGEYANDSSSLSSGLLDISQWEGQDKELFFGLFPAPSTQQLFATDLGSSANESVAVDSISFITVPEPNSLILMSVCLALGVTGRRRRCG